MLRLFEHPLSPYARKVKIVLEWKGVPYEPVFVSPMDTSSPAFQAFLTASPRLEVPCFVDDDGTTVFDSTILLDYADEKWPAKPSLPATPAERARVRMLEEFCDTQVEAVNWGLMEVRFFKRAEGALADSLLAHAREQWLRFWGRLERELQGREWMNGANFGRGDAAVYPHITGSAFFGMPLDPKFDRLADWAARCAEEPAVRADADQLAKWMQQNLGGGARSAADAQRAAGERSSSGPGAAPMPIVRQYRDHRLEWMMKSGGVDVVLRGLEAGTIRFQQEFE